MSKGVDKIQKLLDIFNLFEREFNLWEMLLNEMIWLQHDGKNRWCIHEKGFMSINIFVLNLKDNIWLLCEIPEFSDLLLL